MVTGGRQDQRRVASLPSIEYPDEVPLHSVSALAGALVLGGQFALRRIILTAIRERAPGNHAILPQPIEAAESAARKLFGVIDALLRKLHYSVHDQIEVAWICDADYVPYPFEGRAHVRGELRKDFFSAHYPAPI